MDSTVKSRRWLADIGSRAALYVALVLFTVFFLFPLFVLVSNSLRPLADIKSGSVIALPYNMTFEAWRQAWGEACIGTECGGLRPHFWISVRIVVPAVLISTAVGALNGYALTKWRFRGSETLFALILFGCFIPYQVILLPMAQTLGYLGLAGTPAGLTLVYTLYGLPFTTLFARNYYVALSDELVRAATIDGAGFFATFWFVLLPISGPILVVTLIWQFTGIWNDFLFGSSFSPTGEQQPLIVALNNMVNTTTGVKYYNIDFAASLIAAMPTLVIYVLSGRYFVRGLTAGSVKG